jgi:hypothetical protein
MDTPKFAPVKAVSTKPETVSPTAVQEQQAVSSAPDDSRIEPVFSASVDTPATIIPAVDPTIETTPAPVSADVPVEQTPPAPTAKKEIITTAVILPEKQTPIKKPEIPLLRDADIKLQSISWSKNPSKRLAVVSNRIVREGEMVSGYLLVTINKDDLILSQKGKKWRINFRIK